MVVRAPMTYRRLRAPAGDGQWLFDPPPDWTESLLQENAQSLDPLSALRAGARRELFDAARRFTAAYREVPRLDTNGTPQRLILGGHQPELFHPGVWMKNFALDCLARQTGAVAINLIIDNDRAGAPSIRVPQWDGRDASTATVAFDHAPSPLSYEDYRLGDVPFFASFGRRVVEQLGGLVERPLIQRLWPLAVEALSACGNVGEALARARHQVELQWGLQTLELPMSRLARLAAYRRFVVHLLGNLPRFAEIHNQALARYRTIHHLRGTTHPVPDLAIQADRIEAPFWIHSMEQPRRARLFVRRLAADRLELSDEGTLPEPLVLDLARDEAAALEHFEVWEHRGIKLRPRALTTTLIARLIFSDLFVHGIGGAKYDQVTDAIIEQFWSIRPPAFHVVSATFQLPLPTPETGSDDLRRVERELRDLRFTPDRYLSSDAASREDASLRRLLEEKRRLLEEIPSPADRAAWHRAVTRVNERLAPYAQSHRQELLARREAIQRGLRNRRVLGSREFSFCLFPPDRFERIGCDEIG